MLAKLTVRLGDGRLDTLSKRGQSEANSVKDHSPRPSDTEIEPSKTPVPRGLLSILLTRRSPLILLGRFTGPFFLVRAIRSLANPKRCAATGTSSAHAAAQLACRNCCWLHLSTTTSPPIHQAYLTDSNWTSDQTPSHTCFAYIPCTFD